MKLPILSLLILISILLNGCLVDRIKQRIYVNQLREQSKQHNIKKATPNTTNTTNITNTTRQNVTKEVKVTPDAVSYPTKTLYKPSESRLVANTTKTYKTKKKVIKTSKKKVVKKRKKKVVKKIKKVVSEPYSIKKDESDPELLGPQTTLESNPLAKKRLSDKVDNI